MKKDRIPMKLFGSSLAVAACLTLAWVGTSSASTDMAGMLDEGISYENAAPQKSFMVIHDNRADLEASMAEGIVYEESVIASDKAVIRLDHHQATLLGMEACLCEDPTALVVESQMAKYQSEALESKPAAGSEK
ncbi:MAG: hypothetical protein KKC76_04200 [Proteobacteria bacterium]|nr:hypothetical protein [Pseudomonadota bacterium]MBU4298058.1 hypothetical protein [Pseudomonadota bacterium]MCG2746345.1 hypothetical protein [Desulfobulbaceae bacterium]